MKSVSTKRAAANPVPKPDWSRLDRMTGKQVLAAALSDPDARPLTALQWKSARLTPRIFIIRRAFRLTQAEFAAAFGIPIGTIRDWEQRRKQPDAAARAYLKVIAANPDAVRAALSAVTRLGQTPKRHRRQPSQSAAASAKHAPPKEAKAKTR